MKRKLLLFGMTLWGFSGTAQEPSTDYVVQINRNLYDVGDVANHPPSLTLLEDCVNQGDSNCQNWLGILYNQGLGVLQNEHTAFDLIQKASTQGNETAQYNLGRFYMIGTGCNIDFDKAQYWLQTAANQGNERAAYALGYMAMKGFGVPQDYKKAVYWYALSGFPMAKHWLGVCYYFGYGVEKNEDKALVLLSQSHTPNSQMMLKHIAENVKQTVDASLSKEINQSETHENTAIAKETLEKNTKTSDVAVVESKKVLKPSYFEGQWKGKLVELDWSGKEILRVVPIVMAFEVENNAITYSWLLNGKTTNGTAILEDNSLYYDNLEMVLEMPYTHNPKSNSVLWQVLSSKIEFKTINNKTYLIANLETFTDQWHEQGPPMRIILKQTQDGEDELSDDELLAISQQKDQFIVLYPNPFINDVLIAYTLDTDAQVSVNVFDFTGNATPITLEPGRTQTAGQHHYTLEGSRLKPGMYIVRVTVGDKMHSRILIKK